MKKLLAMLFAVALLVGLTATSAGAAGGPCPPASHNPGATPPNCGHAPPQPPPPPPAGNCQHADIVLLNAQNKLVCVYFGAKAPLASTSQECPDALIALPVDNVVGVCVFLPPAQ